MIGYQMSGFAYFSKGFKAVFRGLGFINRNGLWGYIVFPLLLSIALGFMIQTYVAVNIAYLFSENIFILFPALKNIGVLSTILSFILHFASFLVVWYLTLFLYTMVGGIVWSFFSGPLYDKADFILTGNKKKAEFRIFNALKLILNSIWDAIKDLFFLIIGFLFSLIFYIIPFLGFFLQFILIIIINSYLIGKINFRYVAEKETDSIKGRDNLVRTFLKPESIGLGLPEAICGIIPFGFCLFFFIWSGSLVGAKILYEEEYKKRKDTTFV